VEGEKLRQGFASATAFSAPRQD